MRYTGVIVVNQPEIKIGGDDEDIIELGFVIKMKVGEVVDKKEHILNIEKLIKEYVEEKVD